jgi:tetratricopeptide (TPR) repeat protein
MMPGRDAGRRALRTARDAVWALRTRTADAEHAAAAMSTVVDRFEAVLRLRLRDDEDAPLETRLSALVPDEVDATALVAELRVRERISLETAAGFHELVNLRRRIAAGGSPAARDVELAVEIGERIEREMARAPSRREAPGAPDGAEAAEWAADRDETVASESRLEDPEADTAEPRSPAWLWGLAVAALALLLVAVWAVGGSRDRSLQEGIVLFRSGAYAEAEPHFRRHAEANPRDVTPRIYLARSYRRLRQYDQAANALREGLAIDSDDPGLQRELGFLLLDTGRPDAAVERFRAAVTAEPESADGWLGLLRSLRESGRGDAAERVIVRAPAEVQALLRERAASDP